MWNNTDTPLAYLISFRSYGTWLHGDPRGSIDRFNNRYRSPYIKPNPQWEAYMCFTVKATIYLILVIDDTRGDPSTTVRWY
jgi:hypothetical protein